MGHQAPETLGWVTKVPKMRFGIRASLSTAAGEVAWAQDLSGTFSMATLDASGSYGGKPHSSCSLGKATPVSGEGSLENSGNQGLGICLSLFAKVFSTLASTGLCPHFSSPCFYSPNI